MKTGGISLCDPRWSGTHYVAQASPKVIAILLLQLPKCWDYRHELPCLVSSRTLGSISIL